MAPSRARGDARRAERLFLELIRPGTPRGCGDCTSGELRATAALAFGHGMFLLLDRRVREHTALFPAGLVTGEYENAVRPLRQRHIRHALCSECEERDAVAVLETAGLPSVVLKGSALSRELFGEPHCRSSADVDLLVRAADVPAADATLTAAGYRRDNDRPLSFWMRRLHHAVYRRAGHQLPVEIHWNFSIPGFFNLEPDQIWSGVELEGLRGRLLPLPRMTLLLMHHHLHGCMDLRTLVDLVWAFERQGQETQQDRLTQQLASVGLRLVAEIVGLQAGALWGARAPERAGCASRRSLRAALLARATAGALRPGRRRRASDRFLHALVHRLALDSPRRVVAAVAKTILPSAADLRELSGRDRVGVAEYVRYFRWRLGGRASGDGEGGGLGR